MLYKLSLIAIILGTISFFTYFHINNVMGGFNEVVVISDEDVDRANKDINEKGEIVIDDEDFREKLDKVSASSESREEDITDNKDGSTSSVMYDGFGNKTETKKFERHSRLRMIIVRTSANGDRQAFIYGLTGKVTMAPHDMLDKILSASPDELANKAGIYETPADRERRKLELAEQKKERIQQKQQQEEFEVEKKSIPEPAARENRQLDQSAEENN